MGQYEQRPMRQRNWGRFSVLLFAVWIGLFSMEALSVNAENEIIFEKKAEIFRRESLSGESLGESLLLTKCKDNGMAIWHLRKDGDKKPKELIPGGMPFGVRFYTDGVMIYKLEDQSPFKKAGLAEEDIICTVDGKKIEGTADLMRIFENLQKESFVVEYCREGELKRATITADHLTDTQGLPGIYVRDSLAGIGTLTFYDPESRMFAGLGHGICKNNRGELLPLRQGSITDVRITSVTPGAKGAPGQLRGLFCPGNKGEVFKNTTQGIFGVWQSDFPSEQVVPVATREEIRQGKAEILCTVKDGGVQRYEVEIEKILSFDTEGRNYLLRVTDEKLLCLTGGIVQGMSGSPILQDGKIVGAVTHVLMDDPQRGYGIFIGNMLENM